MYAQTQSTDSTARTPRGTNAAEALRARAQYIQALNAGNAATENEAQGSKEALSLCAGDCSITADARTLLGQCAEVAKGARFYVDNFDCEDVAGGKECFATACLGLIGFALDAIDAHYCSLDENGRLPRANETMTLIINYCRNK